MTKEGFIKIAKNIKLAYPTSTIHREDVLTLWFDCLNEYDDVDVLNAVYTYIKSCKYPPSISDIVTLANEEKSKFKLEDSFRKALAIYPNAYGDVNARSVYFDLFEGLSKGDKMYLANKIHEGLEAYVAEAEKKKYKRIPMISEVFKNVADS